MISTKINSLFINMHQMTARKNIIISGLFFLFIGVSVYLFLYPNKFNYGYKVSVNSSFLLLIIFSITSLFHVFFMTAFSVVMSSQLITPKVIICWAFFWSLLDTAFEILQSVEKINFYLGDNLLSSYFNSGFFDVNDVIAIWIGFIFVVNILIRILRNNERND